MITNSFFTKQAIELAEACGVKLLNRYELEQFIIKRMFSDYLHFYTNGFIYNGQSANGLSFNNVVIWIVLLITSIEIGMEWKKLLEIQRSREVL